MKECENRKFFWINVTNDDNVHINKKLSSFASNYDNLYIIDWNSISSGHPEYFFADGIHLTENEKKEYSKAIYDAIYQIYLEEYNSKKEEIIKKHEEEKKSKISFYGNDILLTIFDELQSCFQDAKFIINKDFSYDTLKKEIIKEVQNESLTYKIVFAFNNQIKLSSSQIQELIQLCSNHKIYILSTDNAIIDYISNQNYKNVTLINFYQEIKKHKDYLMIDGIHLTEKGNYTLTKILNDMIKKVSNP